MHRVECPKCNEDCLAPWAVKTFIPDGGLCRSGIYNSRQPKKSPRSSPIQNSLLSSATPAPPRPKISSRFYRPELDLLRFFAFLLVFLTHTMSDHERPGLVDHIRLALRDTGAFGVCLFFTLSSYLISELLMREHEKTGMVHIKAFYIRRILRIWPLYLLMLALGYVAGRLGFTDPITLGRVAAFILFSGNWYVGIYGFTRSFISVLWSISVEEQFYLIWPAIARFCNRKGLLVTGIGLLILSFAALAILCQMNVSLNDTIWTNSFVQFQFFAIGALVAVWLNGRIPRISRLRPLLLLTGFLCYFVADFVFHIKRYDFAPMISQTIPGYFLAGIGTLLIFLGVLGMQLPEFAEPFVWLGKRSYGLYVFHGVSIWLVQEVLGNFIQKFHHGSVLVIPVGFFLTILLATISYRFFETPFLQLKKRFTLVPSREI